MSEENNEEDGEEGSKRDKPSVETSNISFASFLWLRRAFAIRPLLLPYP
jgi:hypothetical protein